MIWKDTGILNNWICILALYLFFINNIFEKLMNFKSNNITYVIMPSFLFILLFLTFIDSFLSLFFLIELYGVLYYFFFLTSYNFTTQTILKYKNGLLLLLWNNFLTTIFLTFGCFLIFKEFGTTNFNELNFMTPNGYGFHVFLVGLAWKLGLPTFHFFKLEVYRYLLKENVFLFSAVTTLINFFLFYAVFSKGIIALVVSSINFTIILVSVTIPLLILNLKTTNILQFFALSGLLTMTTVIITTLINKWIYMLYDIIFR